MSAQPTEVGLSLGSSLGNRLAQLQEARRHIAEIDGVTLIASAPVYETDPVGVREEYRDIAYLNSVVIVECTIPAIALSDAIHQIEDDMGRVRGDDRYAPRPIDIDMVYFGGEQHAGADLTIPHTSWANRRFVVQPLADLRPDLILPGEKLTCRAVLSALPDSPRAILFKQQW